MAEPERWISLHAFHRGGTDRLIGQAVGGLVRSLDADGLLARFFFLRYWEGGPHLRLRLSPAARAAEVEQRARAALERHLAAYPTRTPWDPRRYAVAAERLASMESLQDYDRRLRSRDGVEAVPYRPEHHVFGGPEATRAAERHFDDSSRIALALLAREEERGRLAGFAAAALTLALAAWEPDPGRLGHVLATDRERWDPPGERSRRAELLDRHRLALRGQVLRCLRIATGQDVPGDGDPLGAWWRSIDTLRGHVVRLQAEGRFRPPPSGSSFQPPGTSRARGDVLVLLVRCVHLLCNRLGLAGPEEAHLRHLVGTALIDAALIDT
ncbi:lantibiotic dehydratase C-terminal domain-containing protein [Nonomuraea sp. NPDC050783]|uniref:lantibiotic dehydratase C-terminal domain-containing protein n=1 Tax=Nonomuraea sp. NPDC050783 TaxID=3154634 RepID=UPI0034669678